MALKEEFEYLNFRCCYCFALNPARKKRLQAPKLTYELQGPSMKAKVSDTSESEKNSPTDTESDEDHAKKEVKTLYDPQQKSSDNERASDFDKLSDFEQKLSDNEMCSTTEKSNATTVENNQVDDLDKKD